jgi:hypothetical protein
MPDPCPNHGVVTDEQKQSAVKRLADALTLLWDGHVATSDGVRQELQHAEIFGGIEGLPMDLAGVCFQEQSRLARHRLAYTIDWMLKREPAEIARHIDKDIRERLSSS